jgi:hypothetical protein
MYLLVVVSALSRCGNLGRLTTPTAMPEVAYLLGEQNLLVTSKGRRQRHPADVEAVTSKSCLTEGSNAVRAYIFCLLTTEQHAKMSDINTNVKRLQWRISCYSCLCCLNRSFYLRDFNTVYAFNDCVLSQRKASREQSSCFIRSFFLRTLLTAFRCTSIFLTIFVVSSERQLVRDAVSLFRTFFFNALLLFQYAFTFMLIQLQVNAMHASMRL